MFVLKFRVVLSVTVVCLLLLTVVQSTNAQISKGQQILIARGLQIQGLSQDDCYLHLGTYSNANYTSIQWDNSPGQHSSRPEWMGPAPGFPWARWAMDSSQMPPQIVPTGGDETPYMPQLLALQLADEWNLNDGNTRTNLIKWFLSVRTNYPGVILYHNNYGSQVGDSELFDFYSKAQPDMLCFDTYPWMSVWDVNQPNHTGPVLPGPPTGWYGDLRRHREHARGAGIPLGMYRQAFHSVQDYDQHVFRDPSASEFRLLTFAGLAFNAKYISDFIYNTGANSFFTNAFNGAGDSYIGTNGLYAEMQDANKRARNFGKALVNLTPITTEGYNGFTTSILFIRGYDANGNVTTIPVGFLADQDTPGANYTDWVYQRNDSYLTNNWTVANKGDKNSGRAGDVIIAWFKPLDEALDGTNYNNEVYMMVVNGLTDPTGAASNCLQEITLNFANSVTALDVLNPTSGVVQTQALPLTNGLRQLVLNLNGGDATLFKFADGAPFAGFTAPIIVTEPTGSTNLAGTSATFSTRTGGAPPLNFQWRANGTNIPGASLYTYTRTNIQLADALSYSVVISNSMGSVTSSIASISVLQPPQIITQPTNKTVSSGTDASFVVVATGNPSPGYQWLYSGSNIFGATTSTYTRANVQSADTGNYIVVVSNGLNVVTSSVAVLTVNGPPSITAQPLSQAVLTGGSATFVVGAVGSGALTYQWERDGFAIGDATTSVLALNNIQSADLGNYAVTVSNLYGTTLSAAANLAFAGLPSIQTQPQSATANVGASVFLTVGASGGGLSYQWQRAGTNISDGGNLRGANTSTLGLTGVSRLDATNYIVIVTNAAGSVTSSPALLIVTFAYPLTEPFNYPSGSVLSNQITPDLLSWTDVGTISAGPVVTNGPGNLAVSGLAASSGNSVRFGGAGKSARLSLTGHVFNSGTVYFSIALSVLDLTGSSSTGGFILGFNNSTGTQGGQPTVVAPRVYLRTNSTGFNLGVAKNSDTDTVWDTTTYSTNQTIFIVSSYTFNPALGDDIVKMWINPDPSTFGLAGPPVPTLIATNGSDIGANQIASFVLFQRVGSGTPEPAIMIGDELRIDTTWGGVTPPAVPVIVMNPSDLAVNAGTTNFFVVGAVGSNLSYQWIRNGVPVSNGDDFSGAATSALKIGPTFPADAGTYQVIVSSAGNAVLSSPATLSVNAEPSISMQPQSQSVNYGSTAVFSIGVNGTAPFGYQWRVNSTNIPGANGSSYSLTNIQRFNAGNYSAFITNLAGNILSSNAYLTVIPVIPVQMSGIALLSDGRLQLTGSGDPGQFIIQTSSNLFNWSDLTNLTAESSTFQYTDKVTNAPQKFYRLKLYP